MQNDVCVHPSNHAYVALLKTCTKMKDLKRGYGIHGEVARIGLIEQDIFVGSTVVDMYAKCGALSMAKQVFGELPQQNEVSWNVLMSGYVEHGLGEDALDLFEHMTGQGITPNAVTFLLSLKACGSTGSAYKGLEMHCTIERIGLLERHLSVGSALVDMYAKCGWLAKGEEVFARLASRNVVSWTSLITGYAEHGHGSEALNCFEEMQSEGVSPDAVTFVWTLKACGSTKSVSKCLEIHAEIERKGLTQGNVYVGSALVDAYARCGLISKAREILLELSVRNIASWNALVSGYAEHGYFEEVLKCFDQMRLEGIQPDSVTFLCGLKACGSLGDSVKGEELHAEIDRNGLLEIDLIVGSALVDMYARCGLLAQAQEVFDELPDKDVVSWTAIISGYTDHGCSEQALECFERMQLEGVHPNSVTFACSLKACASAGAICKGQEIHEELAKRGLTETDQLVTNALIDMYAKSGLLSKAREVLENLLVRDLVSWNALISGYAMHGHGKEALNCYEQMQVDDGIMPDDITLVCCLKACGSLCAVEEGLHLHAEISRRGFLERDHVGNILVDMYVKCGFLLRAEDVLDELPYQSAVSWNSLISGYIKHGCYEEAMNLLERMHAEGVFPDVVTHVCALKACGNMGLIEKGEEMHRAFSKEGLFERDLTLGNALVDMYVKCGLLSKAEAAFDKLPSRDIIAWTSLISGHGQVGNCEDAIDLFNKMSEESVEPNLVTFVSVLNACSRAGLVDMGEAYLEAMIREYGVIPKLEHYTCMVDLLSRAGQIKKAVTLTKHMPFHPDLVVWHTMLGVGQQWGSLELGSQAFKHAVPLDAKDPLVYVFLSNIYADYRTEHKSLKMEGLGVC